MGIIEGRRRQLAQAAIEQTQRDRVARENNERENQSLLAARQCLEQSGFQPLLQLLVPEATSRVIAGGWEHGRKVYPPERFRIGQPQDHKVGLTVLVYLGGASVSRDDGFTYSRSSNFSIKFHPDGEIVIEAGPQGSRTISVSDLSQSPTLGEEVLEKAYRNPRIREGKSPTPQGPVF